MGEAWERQPNEPARAYAAFTVYRDLGPTRSLDAAAVAMSEGQQEGNRRAASGHLLRTSSKWSWPQRARAWDARQDELALEAAERRAREEGEAYAARFKTLQDNGFRVAERLLDRIEAMLAFPVSRKEVREEVDVGGKKVATLTVITPARWAWRDLAQMLYRLQQVATTIMRPPDQKGVNVSTTAAPANDPSDDLIKAVMGDPEAFAQAKKLAMLLNKQDPPTEH